MKIIHLSDIHFEIEKEGSLSYKKQQLYNGLIQDLKQYIDDDSIMVLTGDLINKGGMNFGQENPFLSFKNHFISLILKEFPSLSDKIFIVPGNHDIIKTKIDKIIHNGIIAISKSDYNEVSNFIIENQSTYDKLKHIELYKNFEKEFYKDYPNIQVTNFQTTAIVKLNKIKVGIACLNSAWLISPDDENDYANLILGSIQIEQALKKINNTDFKIALFHHPIDYFSEKDKENIKSLLFDNFNMILTGHSHKIETGYHQTLEGNTFISISPSILDTKENDPKFPTGYTIIEKHNKSYEVVYRKYLYNHTKFVSNTDIGNDKGKKSFFISEEQSQLNNKINISLEFIKNTYVDEINNDLIIYNAEDGLPDNLEEIFVSPIICNILESQAQTQNEKIEEEIKYYSLEEILLSNKNFLIYGKKEIGKTILLDFLLLELTKNYKKYNKIPVLIKFQNIKNKDIETCIKQFISVESRAQIKDMYIKGTKFVLLIDDLTFAHYSSNKLKKLINFMSQFPKIQIIATSLHKLESIVPENHLEYNQYFNFNVVYIHYLRTPQIKSLIQKWFKNKNVDFQSNIEQLIKNFQELGLPRTPLTLTMFLWIIQKQEKKPINSAVLAEIFIENLLEKANFENVLSGTFDFYNKKRLLAFLAHYMLKNGDPQDSYAINYSEALNFTMNYLKGKTGDPKTILDNLIHRGIFIEDKDNSIIKFKFAFYFHFFLSAYIEFEESFLENEIFSNILEFKDELEYYTGLNRDKNKILELALKELEFTYKDLNDLLFKENRGDLIDEILETKNPLSNHINLDRVKEMPSDEILDKTYDETLQQLPVKKQVKPKQLLSNKEKKYKLAEIIELSANLLKNLEEIDFDLKYNAYNVILKSSISFLILYRQYLLENYENLRNSSFLPKEIDFNVFINLLPVFYQVVLYDWLGSIKLEKIISKKIDQDNLNNNVSEFEKFLSVFVYSDIKATNYRNIIKKFYKISKSKYILDAIFFKLLTYYFLRSRSRETDRFYLNILADIKVKLKQINKTKKSQFIEKIKKDKRKQLNKNNKQDSKL